MDGGIWEGQLCLLVHSAELSVGGLVRIIVLAVDAHREDHCFYPGVNLRFLKDLSHMMEGCPRVAVYLYVGVV